MTNFEDDRVSFRIDPELKRWLAKRGGSKFIRKIIIAAYEQLEKTKYEDNK